MALSRGNKEVDTTSEGDGLQKLLGFLLLVGSSLVTTITLSGGIAPIGGRLWEQAKPCDTTYLLVGSNAAWGATGSVWSVCLVLWTAA
jgi:hypothetical protein